MNKLGWVALCAPLVASTFGSGCFWVTTKSEGEQLRKDLPQFKPGDTVRVHVRVVEGDKERIQVFEGTVIGRKGGASRETFTVRKTSYGVGVERTFPVHSPRVDRIEIVAKGAVRRAKLYYLRERAGRAARVTEEA